MPEQRGDGKPVRQSTHHAGLGSGPDVADPGRAALGPDHRQTRKDHRRTEQESERDGLHLAKVARPLGVGVRIRPGQRFSKRDSHDTIIRYFAPKGRRVRRRQQRTEYQRPRSPELSVTDRHNFLGTRG